MRRLLEKRIGRLEEAAGIVTRHCRKPCIACLIVVQGTKHHAFEVCDGVSHRRTLEDILSGAKKPSADQISKARIAPADVARTVPEWALEGFPDELKEGH